MQVYKNCIQILVELNKYVEHFRITWTILSGLPNESTVCIHSLPQAFTDLLPEKHWYLEDKDKLDVVPVL